MIKVSVIMPSLNVGEYIENAIKSVRNQTLSDIEIICVDAGSSDGTWEIILEEAMVDSRIIAVKSPVKSYGFQVNMGIDMANGEYIAVLETDDYVADTMYESLYTIADKDKLDYVKCDYSTYTTDASGNREFVERCISSDRYYYDNVFTPLQHSQVAIDDWYLWNGLYKKEFLVNNSIRFSETPGAAFQDIGFLHHVSAKADRVKYIASSLYRYCVDRDGASSNSTRTLLFIRKEYGLLLNNVGDMPQQGERRLLYIRMARSFVRACMETSDELIIKPEQNDICKWFCIRLAEAERWGYVKESDLPQALREGYRYLLNPVLGYVAYKNIIKEKLKEFLGTDNRIVIFGCGNYGKQAGALLIAEGYKIDRYMDNDEALWGKTIEGIPIVSPDYVPKFSSDTRYIIANEKYGEEIKKQLKEYREDIMTFLYSL